MSYSKTLLSYTLFFIYLHFALIYQKSKKCTIIKIMYGLCIYHLSLKEQKEEGRFSQSNLCQTNSPIRAKNAQKSANLLHSLGTN